MSFDQRDTIGFQAAQLSRLISNRVHQAALEPLRLLPAQVAALVEIGTDDGLSQKTLVERLDVEQPGVARTLASLEAEGWISRQSKAGRTQGLHLTEEARAALPEAARRVAVNREALGSEPGRARPPARPLERGHRRTQGRLKRPAAAGFGGADCFSIAEFLTYRVQALRRCIRRPTGRRRGAACSIGSVSRTRSTPRSAR